MTDRTALLIAHPGHELRVHHWLESSRPEVCVLTDGSGSSAHPRISETEHVLARSRAQPGPLFGRFSDRDIYGILREGRVDVWRELTQTIAAWLRDISATHVVSDGYEGFNPSHDLCFLLAERASQLAAQEGGSPVEHSVFPLEGSPDQAWLKEPVALQMELDDDALGRKLDAARAYRALESEVERALDGHGLDAFRREVLRRPVSGAEYLAIPSRPRYEAYGEERVREGRYAEVLRREAHVRPAADSIAAAG